LKIFKFKNFLAIIKPITKYSATKCQASRLHIESSADWGIPCLSEWSCMYSPRNMA